MKLTKANKLKSIQLLSTSVTHMHIATRTHTHTHTATHTHASTHAWDQNLPRAHR